MFAEAHDLLDDAEIDRAPMEYPRLRGRYRGQAVTIEAIVDHIAVRKLPSLWLSVTVKADLPFAGSCDILARSHNVEFYSPAIAFDHVLPRPPEWPEHLTIKSDAPEAMPPREILDRHIDLFAEPLTKELLITPHGVRLLRQAAQAKRSEYLVLRQALFGPVVLPRALLVDLLDRALRLIEDLRRAPKAGKGDRV